MWTFTIRNIGSSYKAIYKTGYNVIVPADRKSMTIKENLLHAYLVYRSFYEGLNIWYTCIGMYNQCNGEKNGVLFSLGIKAL